MRTWIIGGVALAGIASAVYMMQGTAGQGSGSPSAESKESQRLPSMLTFTASEQKISQSQEPSRESVPPSVVASGSEIRTLGGYQTPRKLDSNGNETGSVETLETKLSPEQPVLRREGTKFIDVSGTIRRLGNRFEFVYSDETGKPYSLMLLENQILQRVEHMQDQRTAPIGQLRWRVSGVLTEYRQSNFLLLERAVQE